MSGKRIEADQRADTRGYLEVDDHTGETPGHPSPASPIRPTLTGCTPSHRPKTFSRRPQPLKSQRKRRSRKSG